MRILLWTKDNSLAEALRAQLGRVFSGPGLSFELCLHRNERCALRTLQAGQTDLAFLDLHTSANEVFSAAAQIRRQHLLTELVFLSDETERMAEAFPYRPIGFLPRRPSDAQIDSTLAHFMQFYRREDGVYSLERRAQRQRIPHREILYFSSSGHRVTIHLAGDQPPLSQTKRLSEIELTLKDAPFVRIHQSFLVRIDAIASIDRTRMRVVLHSGEELPISRSRYAFVAEQFRRSRTS